MCVHMFDGAQNLFLRLLLPLNAQRAPRLGWLGSHLRSNPNRSLISYSPFLLRFFSEENFSPVRRSSEYAFRPAVGAIIGEEKNILNTNLCTLATRNMMFGRQ